ncbi:MAG: ADP-forming succinate--CoA ligase subunit beta [Acidiferrobacterales bacterium]
MNLHEYQAKDLFATYGMPVPAHQIVTEKESVASALAALGGDRWVVKAQVHAGGRGKAGGVKLVGDADAALRAVTDMLGKNLVTVQTDERGQPVNQVMIEQPCEIERELYLGAVVDRSSCRIVIMASTEGGVEIEKVARDTPGKILKISIDPMVGIQPYQGRRLAFGLGLEGNQIRQFGKVVNGLARLFHDKDLGLVEINPLVITKAGDLLCLDGKISIDDNALYRHRKFEVLRDQSQEDAREVEAREWGLSYIALDGDIGCMVNGAGLAMATMDLIKLHGGSPANFLDVGGTATRERVAEAFKLILSDANVKGVLVNIFGGIVRCDMIAEGIVGAVEEVGINVPVVVRLIGNNAGRGREILNDSGLKIHAEEDLTEAARAIIDQVQAVA